MAGTRFQQSLLTLMKSALRILNGRILMDSPAGGGMHDIVASLPVRCFTVSCGIGGVLKLGPPQGVPR
jgi:hypothetical protein